MTSTIMVGYDMLNLLLKWQVRNMRRVNLEKIRGLRKQKNLTQWQIAQKIGYKTGIGYHYLETGRCKIKAEQLDVIASVLGVTTEELYEQNTTKLVDQPTNYLTTE